MRHEGLTEEMAWQWKRAAPPLIEAHLVQRLARCSSVADVGDSDTVKGDSALGKGAA